MPTVLIFARQPLPGQVKTRLAASLGDAAACRLYTAFLRDLCTQLTHRAEWQITWWVDGDPDALKTGMAASWRENWATNRQPQGELGHRLEIAFEDAFTRQQGPVAVIGSDCPQLGSGHLAEMFASLEERADAALLPAEDGGYAALALKEPVPGVFQGIPWSTAEVCDETVARLHEAGRRVTMLPPVFDVDTLAELRRLDHMLRQQPELAPHTAAALSQVSMGAP